MTSCYQHISNHYYHLEMFKYGTEFHLHGVRDEMSHESEIYVHWNVVWQHADWWVVVLTTDKEDPDGPYFPVGF